MCPHGNQLHKSNLRNLHLPSHVVPHFGGSFKHLYSIHQVCMHIGLLLEFTMYIKCVTWLNQGNNVGTESFKRFGCRPVAYKLLYFRV